MGARRTTRHARRPASSGRLRTPIQNVRPSYYLHFDTHIPRRKGASTRSSNGSDSPPNSVPTSSPSTTNEPDHSGHQFGPDSPEVRAAVTHHVDACVGKLKRDLDALHTLPIDLIVVSDHGPEKVQDAWIHIDKYADLTIFETDGAFLYPKGDQRLKPRPPPRSMKQLKKADSRFIVYRRAQVPVDLDFNQNPREGGPVIVPAGPYIIRAHAPVWHDHIPDRRHCGIHGYDPAAMKSMRAIFYAIGPDIRPDTTVKPFENANIHLAVAQICSASTHPKSTAA